MDDEQVEQLNEVDKFIILLAGANESEPIPGPLHLQKEMYLLQNLFSDLADETDYEPYFMGQHSEIVANELEELKLSRLMKGSPGPITLTADGDAVLARLRKTSDQERIKKVEEFKEILNDMTKKELLAFVYFSDPAQDVLAEESTEFKDIAQNRKHLAISMYKKDKISAQKAAEIAGESLEDFLDELKRWCK